ncbi:Uncharacterised protein [Acidipropionibacterium jensenii]|uniref:Uncharacterized protein n=1 Tax=Acidipropionibacterium jensenii TaxID=1749 RepID=A0A3S4V8E5_9ACTN|nr:hypothetical protein [Acidipropionibacterium jensenii]VEI04140.1 Uncharacterised protein [Acidipropionibacterium jensenii]
MSARDDLAQLLVKRAGDHIQMLDGGPEENAHSVSIGLSMNWAAIADIILAAGFHRDRNIETEEELEALPEESLVRDADGVHLTKDYESWYMTRAEDPDDVVLPATVLWEPEADDE